MTEQSTSVLSNTRPEHGITVCFKKLLMEALGARRQGTS
jgi:hypothetical protein